MATWHYFSELQFLHLQCEGLGLDNIRWLPTDFTFRSYAKSVLLSPHPLPFLSKLPPSHSSTIVKLLVSSLTILEFIVTVWIIVGKCKSYLVMCLSPTTPIPPTAPNCTKNKTQATHQVFYALCSLTSDYLSDFTFLCSLPHPLCDYHPLCTNHSHTHSNSFFHLEGSFPLYFLGFLPSAPLVFSLSLRVGPGDQWDK